MYSCQFLSSLCPIIPCIQENQIHLQESLTCRLQVDHPCERKAPCLTHQSSPNNESVFSNPRSRASLETTNTSLPPAHLSSCSPASIFLSDIQASQACPEAILAHIYIHLFPCPNPLVASCTWLPWPETHRPSRNTSNVHDALLSKITLKHGVGSPSDNHSRFLGHEQLLHVPIPFSKFNPGNDFADHLKLKTYNPMGVGVGWILCHRTHEGPSRIIR